MRNGKGYLLPLLLLTVAAGAFVGTGCNKSDGIDNETVIRTPYGVYFSDRLGALYNTNDGKAFKTVFPTDGYSARAISTSGVNILWIKNNLHVSSDDGLNFNPSRIGGALLNPNPAANWSSMILDVPRHDRIYVATTTGTTNGVAYSENHGITWQDDISWAVSGVAPQSFAETKDGRLYALDNNGPRLFERLNKLAAWTEVTMNTALPPATYQLSHFNNTLVAADVNGAGGVFFSNDYGVNWYNYPGIPTNQEIFSINAPFEQVLLAGTDSAGIYRLNGNSFEPSNNGLAPFTKVYGIVGKQDMYKNEKIIQYVYIATSNGIFRSEDLGQNWTLVRPGDFRTIY